MQSISNALIAFFLGHSGEVSLVTKLGGFVEITRHAVILSAAEGSFCWVRANPCRPLAIGPMCLAFSAFAQLAVAQTRRSLNLKMTNP